jgi:Tol biopolymer transport system component
MAVWRGSLPADDTAGAGLHYSVWISTSGAEPVEYANGPSVKTPFTPVFLRFSPNNSLLYLSFVNETGSETWLLPFPADSKTPARRVFASTPWNRPVAGSWLADGKRMVLSGNPAPSTGEQLWLADIEKETLTRLTAPGQTSANTPSVSPSGPNSDRILYAQVRRDRDLTEFPLDGSAPRPFLATSLPEYGPSWSPKGDQFAFVTQRTGTDELWVRSAEGKWDRAVVTQRDFSGPLGGPPGGPPTGRSGRGGPSNLQTLVSPSFSPDGERIAYTALRVNADRRRSLAISPAGGGEPTIISDGYAPTWSPDGSTLAFLWLKSDGTLPVATIRVGSDDQPHELVPGPGPSGAPEWSPDGKWIAVPLGFRGVELVSPDGTQRRILPGLENSALLWSLDSKTLYGLTFQAARPALSSMNVATGAVKKIAEYDVSFLPLLDNTYTGSIRMSMSPGGKSFVAATATNQSDLWILDWTARRFGGFKGTDPGKGPKGPPPLPELK